MHPSHPGASIPTAAAPLSSSSSFGPVALALCLSCALQAGVAHAADGGDDAVTPYRPSVSSPAQLPAAGQLELELGGQRARSTDQRRTGLPYLFKLAFNAEWGVLLGGEAHVWSKDAAGNRLQGFGDTTLVLKRAWKASESTGFGVEVGAKLPTARDGIGSGKADCTVNTIFSRDLGPVHLDANVNVARLGAVDDGGSHTQWGASTAVSTALSDRWGLTGEWSGTRRPGADSGSQLLAALTLSPTKRLTVDLGVARAVHPSPAVTTVFAGVVLPLGKWW